MPLFGTDGSPITPDDLVLIETPSSIDVPFPKNYPHTPFYKHQLRRQDPDPVLARIVFTFPDKNTMFITAFYVFTHPSKRQEEKKTIDGVEIVTVSPEALPEERALTKGLGKRLLCAAVRQALASGRVSPNGFIELEASGGKCFRKDITMFMEKWSEAKMNDMITKLKFTDFLPIEEKQHTIEEKAHALCYYLENQKLVAYYQQFGLHPIDASDPYMTTMKGNISNVIETCDAQLGRKRIKLRKFRKTKQIKKSKSKCKCWTGYERVKGTIPCAKKSCRKI